VNATVITGSATLCAATTTYGLGPFPCHPKSTKTPYHENN